jgi:hypothetical protein
VAQSNSLVLGGISNINGCTTANDCASTNVGIGTTTPAFPLDVAGIIRSSTGGFMFPDGSTQATAAGNVAGTAPIAVATSGGTATVSLTACPNGDVLASNGAGWACSTVSGGGGGGVSETGTITVNSLPLFSSATSVGSSNVFQSATNTNIGIGTATPQAALDVSGNVNAAAASAVTAMTVTGFSPTSSGSGGNAIEATGGSVNPNFDTPGGVGGTFQGGDGGYAGDGIDAKVGTGTNSGYAGDFSGDVNVSGTISAGSKNFKIDHPLDPANKYLVHSSVESSEMMNIYTGNVTTDAQGDARVDLPEWFEAVNADFRYQLTVIGQFAQAIVSSEVAGHRFSIRTDKPNVKVSWQITAVRQDAYAKAHPLVIEQQKDARERGHYIHPELYGGSEKQSIEWARHPDAMKRLRDARARRLAVSEKSEESRK